MLSLGGEKLISKNFEILYLHYADLEQFDNNVPISRNVFAFT